MYARSRWCITHFFAIKSYDWDQSLILYWINSISKCRWDRHVLSIWSRFRQLIRPSILVFQNKSGRGIWWLSYPLLGHIKFNYSESTRSSVLQAWRIPYFVSTKCSSGAFCGFLSHRVFHTVTENAVRGVAVMVHLTQRGSSTVYLIAKSFI